MSHDYIVIPTDLARLYSHGLYGYGMYSYGLYRNGLHSYGVHHYGLYGYGEYSYGLKRGSFCLSMPQWFHRCALLWRVDCRRSIYMRYTQIGFSVSFSQTQASPRLHSGPRLDCSGYVQGMFRLCLCHTYATLSARLHLGYI